MRPSRGGNVLRRRGQFIFGGVGEFQEGVASLRTFERLAVKHKHAIYTLGVAASVGNRMLLQQVDSRASKR